MTGTDLTPEEIAEARAMLTRSRPDRSSQAYFLLGWLESAVHSYDLYGYDEPRNRAALAMISAYTQVRADEVVAS